MQQARRALTAQRPPGTPPGQGPRLLPSRQPMLPPILLKHKGETLTPSLPAPWDSCLASLAPDRALRTASPTHGAATPGTSLCFLEAQSCPVLGTTLAVDRPQHCRVAPARAKLRLTEVVVGEAHGHEVLGRSEVIHLMASGTRGTVGWQGGGSSRPHCEPLTPDQDASQHV